MTTSMTNSIWLLLLVVSFAYAQELKLTDAEMAKAKKFTDDCLIAVGGPPDLLQIMNEGKTDPDEKTKCFVKCFYEKVGFFVDAKYNKEVIMQKLGPLQGDELVAKSLERCKDVTGDNDCDKIYKTVVCFSGTHKFIF